MILVVVTLVYFGVEIKTDNMSRRVRRENPALTENSATDTRRALDVGECMAMLQTQQQMLISMVQEQQRLQGELERENQELRQQHQPASGQTRGGRRIFVWGGGQAPRGPKVTPLQNRKIGGFGPLFFQKGPNYQKKK